MNTSYTLQVKEIECRLLLTKLFIFLRPWTNVRIATAARGNGKVAEPCSTALRHSDLVVRGTRCKCHCYQDYAINSNAFCLSFPWFTVGKGSNYQRGGHADDIKYFRALD
jgi:hypothetical protein